MTAGGSLFSHLSWPIKSKKRQRSGSGGSWDLDKKKKNLSTTQQRRLSARKCSSDAESSGSNLEICAPATSDVEFKYSWPIDNFIQQVKTCRGEGLDSKPFEVNVNGVLTTWNLSIRFWVGENGERLANPFVICLNLMNCKVDRQQDVAVKYKFGIYNRVTEEAEMGAPDRVSLKLEPLEKLHSVGYKNIAMGDKHVNASGDILLYVRLSIIREEEANHSLSSDLGNLINDEKSSDLILEAGERKFMVHRNILAARSPVFASLLAQLEEEMAKGETEKRPERKESKEKKVGEKLENIVEDKHKEEKEEEAAQVVEDCDSLVESNTLDSANQIENGETKEDEIEDKGLGETEEGIQGKETGPAVTGNDQKAGLEGPVGTSEGNPDVEGAEVDDGEDDMKQAKGVKKLVIDDLPSDTVEELLKYIYTDSSNNVELFSQTLLAASDRYKLPGLKVHCEKHLGEIINPLNVADILLLSDSYSCRDLKKTALAYCSENHSYIMKDSKWKRIEEEKPALFEEAVALVAPDTCSQHAECLKKGGNRYDVEKNSKGSLKETAFGRKKSNIRKL